MTLPSLEEMVKDKDGIRECSSTRRAAELTSVKGEEAVLCLEKIAG